MTPIVQTSLLWAAVALYALSTAVLANAVLFAHPARTRIALALATAGLLPHGITLLWRWGLAGHGPYMLRAEVVIANAWIAVALALAFLWRWRRWAAAGLVVLPAAFLMIAAALGAEARAGELPPTLRSTWLVFHVSFAKIGAGAFLLSFATAAILLWKLARPAGRLARGTPSPEALDAFAVRSAAYGFFFWTIAVLAGAIWANQAWGRYWAWDTIEVWSLVTWLAYGLLLHARLLFRLRPRATAVLSVACFAVAVVTVYLVPFVSASLHSAYFQ